MSVILLTPLPSTLASIQQRDENAIQISGTRAILGSKAAVLSSETTDSLCSGVFVRNHILNVRIRILIVQWFILEVAG